MNNKCVVCGSESGLEFYNIQLRKVCVCENCANSVTIQNVMDRCSQNPNNKSEAEA